MLHLAAVCVVAVVVLAFLPQIVGLGMLAVGALALIWFLTNLDNPVVWMLLFIGIGTFVCIGAVVLVQEIAGKFNRKS
jgi:hypothetical protein